ncbi:MAG: hypothetical protein GY696_25155 [Gammaproteobacteria bacterium]|nr:hypothetical protein [Gammaproteobacteria bacterium]
MSDSRETRVYILVGIVMAMVVAKSLYDDNQHRNFFHDMREFKLAEEVEDQQEMEAGYRVCLRLNTHAEEHGEPVQDCCTIYYDGDVAQCKAAK